MTSTHSLDASAPDNSATPTPADIDILNATTTKPRFYWEETDDAGLRAPRALAYESEEFLANELNFGGRLLLDVQPVYEKLPDLHSLPAEDTVEEAYSDRIAAILQVAAWHGLDVDVIAYRGLQAQRDLAESAASSAARRDKPRNRPND